MAILEKQNVPFCPFNGNEFFGTSSGYVYQYNGSAFQEVYHTDVPRSISDVCDWNGSLYVSAYQAGNTNNGYAIKSNGSDLSSWQTIISNVACGSEVFLPTDQFLYATTTDNTGWHDSTVRRSTDGVDFTNIIAGPGPFKFPVGNPMLYDGTAYIFENGSPDGNYANGFLITDDGTTTTTTEMVSWDYRILAATELNGQVYAIGLTNGYNVDGNIYLLTACRPRTFGPHPYLLAARYYRHRPRLVATSEGLVTRFQIAKQQSPRHPVWVSCDFGADFGGHSTSYVTMGKGPRHDLHYARGRKRWEKKVSGTVVFIVRGPAMVPGTISAPNGTLSIFRRELLVPLSSDVRFASRKIVSDHLRFI